MSVLVRKLGKLPDPRIHRRRRHLLRDIVTITVCGVLAGCENFVEIERFARAKQKLFRRFLALPGGIPSHDTFQRVFARLCPEALQACLLEWLAELRAARADEAPTAPEPDVIAIDGKTLRRTFDRANGRTALHLVSAWATTHRVTLGQVAVEEKSNEITAIPKLLELIDVSGAVVTIDAAGCQREIAEKIRDRDGDYVLALKGNQETTLDAVQQAFEEALEDESTLGRGQKHATKERGHGRSEERVYYSIPVPQAVRAKGWRDVHSVGLVHSTRRIGDRETDEVRYYLSSLPPGARSLAHAVRAHWGIENTLHWTLDVAFHEDACRLHTGHGAENLAMLNRFALSRLKADTTLKVGVACKRKTAGWDDSYLVQLLIT
jgi:predicted transposase YbfD/YdcC